MPDSIQALQSLGIEMNEKDGYAFKGIRFVDINHRVEATFPAGQGLGVRRTHLHGRLAERAGDLGVQFLWNSRVKLHDRHTASINGKELSFQWLIGADGQSSSVRRWAALDDTIKKRERYGFRYHYRITPWSQFVEVHWGRHGQLYITPVSEDCVCVVFVTKEMNCNRVDILAAFPEIGNRLKNAVLVSSPRGAVSATRRLRRVFDGTAALVGDASGSTDAVTGEGLAMSFRQAQSLAEAIKCGTLERYTVEHQRIGRLPHIMGSLMLTMDRWPFMKDRTMLALAAKPEIFQELLSVHVGAKNLREFAMRSGPRFVLSLIHQFNPDERLVDEAKTESAP
jgi:2-polyprenyl-6-methoxyphenol hydroxylase-like FAD-dependent oxidoreductase